MKIAVLNVGVLIKMGDKRKDKKCSLCGDLCWGIKCRECYSKNKRKGLSYIENRKKGRENI